MIRRWRVSGTYSRAERLSDAAVHVAGITFALLAVPVLVTLAVVWLGDRPVVLAAAIYGLSLIAMVTCSAIYHLAPLPDWKDLLRRIDQSAIYLKIAGTFTPFAIMTGSASWLFLTGLWGAALAGTSLNFIGPGGFRLRTLVFYLAMGWIGAVVGAPMLAALSPAAFALVATGGILYTVGVVFLLWERLPFHNTIWHVFVLAASVILYGALVLELADRAGA